jgi:RNA-directed DNA polymerase
MQRCNSRKRFVLNIDLLDFFPSIHFGRVRGMFTARPYNCNPTVATVLAQICCLPKEYPAGPPYAQLPQGSPTSPIISNMICAKLDSQLRRLAQKYKCSYTRYADDLTFSTNLNRFPESLARFVIDGTGVTSVVIGSELEETISSNKFQINRSKIRLQRSAERQTVTGLTTNESPNITRKYSRRSEPCCIPENVWL